MAKLTLTPQEKRLLAYPPKQGTWQCKRPDCRSMNPEKRALCWACGRHQGHRRKLVYPLYLELCERLGREPAKGTTIHDRRPLT